MTVSTSLTCPANALSTCYYSILFLALNLQIERSKTPALIVHKGMTMTLVAFISLIILSVCAWILEGDRETHLEINELILLIAQLEQEQGLRANLQSSPAPQSLVHSSNKQPCL